MVEEMLSQQPRVYLTRPLSYGAFVSAMKRATLILTDSGGIQEEAPALGVPVLVLRRESERLEAVKAGAARLVGHDATTIAEEAMIALCQTACRQREALRTSPYGDGRAARRIVAKVGDYLGTTPALLTAG